MLSGNLLEDMSITNPEFVQYAALSIKISNYGSANVSKIRSASRCQVDIDVPSGVVIYRDGVPIITGHFQGEPYYDIEPLKCCADHRERSLVKVPPATPCLSIPRIPNSAIPSAAMSRPAASITIRKNLRESSMFP